MNKAAASPALYLKLGYTVTTDRQDTIGLKFTVEASALPTEDIAKHVLSPICLAEE